MVAWWIMIGTEWRLGIAAMVECYGSRGRGRA